MNALTTLDQVRPPALVPSQGRMSVAEVTQHAIAVQEIMRAVMREGEHYGKIPGTDKPTLYKAGAEKLCMTFRIADEYRVEDLSGQDVIRYRVVCVGRHQLSGVELGSGMGEGSSNEEKYKWRRATGDKEYDATPVTMRRIKYGKSWEAKQVRTEPADLANTVLKMACKRAKMAMVLNVTAASDCFTQDLEDLDDTLRQHLTDGADGGAAAAPAQPATWPAEAFATQLPRWTKAVEAGMKTAGDILAMARSKGALTSQQEAAIFALKPAPAASTSNDPPWADDPADKGAAQ